MPGPIEISFVNLSGTTFNISSSYTGYGVEKGIGSLTKQPTDTLPALGGTTSSEMSENAISNLAGGYCWINVGWIDPSTGTHFGVKIYMPTQILHIGSQPYYEVAYSIGGASGPDWNNPVSNPADPYSFPTDVGYNIAITPTSTHTSLEVSVNISDL